MIKVHPHQKFGLALQEIKRLCVKSMPSTTPSHIEEAFPYIRFAFDDSELNTMLRESGTDAVVYHGPGSVPSKTVKIKLFDEHLSLFAPKNRELGNLSKVEIAGLLRGEITDWADLRCGHGPIRLLGHGSPVHLKAFLHLVRSAMGITAVCPEVEVRRDYSGLIDLANSSDNCLVFGLRWTHILRSRLAPVSIGGASPWNLTSRAAIPAQQISLLFDEANCDSLEFVDKLNAYLMAVLQRLKDDALALEELRRGDYDVTLIPSAA